VFCAIDGLRRWGTCLCGLPKLLVGDPADERMRRKGCASLMQWGSGGGVD
jgi:hypothetical protein